MSKARTSLNSEDKKWKQKVFKPVHFTNAIQKIIQSSMLLDQKHVGEKDLFVFSVLRLPIVRRSIKVCSIGPDFELFPALDPFGTIG